GLWRGLAGAPGAACALAGRRAGGAFHEPAHLVGELAHLSRQIVHFRARHHAHAAQGSHDALLDGLLEAAERAAGGAGALAHRAQRLLRGVARALVHLLSLLDQRVEHPRAFLARALEGAEPREPDALRRIRHRLAELAIERGARSARIALACHAALLSFRGAAALEPRAAGSF